jgi:DNA gyrase/topoisomerase IV subunit B
MKQEIKQLSQIDHVLHRPSMYIGSVALEQHQEFMLLNEDSTTFTLGTRDYIPGLIKLFNEVIDNSIDEYVRTNGKYANKISVKMTDKIFECVDNGRGIPNTKMKTLNGDTKYQAEVAFTEMLSGANYENDDEATIGTNGLGSKAAAIFSNKTVINNDDGKIRITITTKNNLSEVSVKESSSTASGVHTKMWPDLAYFGVDEMSITDFNIIKERLLHLSISYPGIVFKFNGKSLRLNNKKYFEMFNIKEYVNVNENVSIGISHSPSDQFEHFSLVNGLLTRKGGSHIKLISDELIAPIRAKLVKKFKTIKPGDIRQKIRVVVIFKNFMNARYTSQTKEELTNAERDIKTYLGTYSGTFDKFTKKILKNEDIMLPITELFLLKEQAKQNAELKKLDKNKKKPKSEKFMPPIGSWTNCFVCEGDSAANSVSKILGRNGNGFFAMFGVPLNAYDANISAIIKSIKMIELKNILGLEFGSTVQNKINFRNIIITTDYDLPGHFITGQLIGLFFKFGKNLFEEGRIKRFVTPLLVATDSKENIVTWFYSFDDYKEFEAKNKSKKYHYDYKKGMGSWDPEELETVIKKDGLDAMLETFVLDENAKQTIENWLGKNSQARKDYLSDYKFDIMSI